MNPEKADYTRKMVYNNPTNSVLASQPIAKINTPEVVPFLDKGAQIAHTHSKVKTQNSEQRTKKGKISKKEDKGNAVREIKQERQSQKQVELKKMIEQEEKAINRLEDELANLKISKKLYEFSVQHSNHSLQKLKVEKQIAMCIRKERELAKKLHQIIQVKNKKIEQYQNQQAEAKLKKQQIIQRLKRLQNSKNKREEILSSKSLPTIPKYKLMEKKFVIAEIRRQLDQNVKSRRLKEYRYKNYLGLGRIQESRMKRSNTENTKKIKQKLKTEGSMNNFNRKQIQQKKNQFILQLEQRRKKKLVPVDKDKELQVAILKDKAKNPLKYNFLKLKNLTEQQIFKQFKDYELNFDPKELGKQYLEELKFLTKPKTKKRKDQDVSEALKNRKISKKPSSHTSKKDSQSIQHKGVSQSRNNGQNLQEEKDIQGSKLFNYKQEISKLLGDSQSKNKVIQMLAQASKKQQNSLIHLKEELQNSREYEQNLKIQGSQASDQLQFLKAKIESLKIQAQQ